MIILLAGTLDGRIIAGQLTADGYKVMITVVSDYGGLLAAESGAEVLVQQLSAEELEALIRTKAANVLIDCTHPYACQVTAMARIAADRTGIMYIRYERPGTPGLKQTNVYNVSSWEQAAAQAAALGDVIFLTTGSRNLAVFLQQESVRGKRVVARVLPDPEVMLLCQSAGLLPRDIIGMQGPFSYDMNKVMFADYGAQVVVTKESGVVGGTDTKVAAAQDLGLPVVVIGRPRLEDYNVAASYDEIRHKLVSMAVKKQDN